MSNHDGSKALNTGRQFEIDLIKAFCILLMIVCHTVDVLTTTGAGDGPLKYAIYFLGNTSSGLFIFCMGIGIVYTSHDSPAAFAKRGIKLLLQGLGLSLLIGFFMGFFSLLIVTGFNLTAVLQSEEMNAVFILEILSFAGFVFLLTALLKKLKCRLWGVLVVAVVFQAIATGFAGVFDNSPVAVRYLMGIFVYTGLPIISDYPLLPFFIYAVFGMLFGKLLKRTANKRTFYLKSAVCGAAVCAAMSVTFKIVGFDITDYIITDLYHSNILPVAIWYISQIAVWAAVSYPISLIVKGKAQKTVIYLSHNITNIYVIQWLCLVLFMIVIAFVTGEALPPVAGAPLSAAILFVTIFLSKRWNTVKTKRGKSQTE